LHFAAIYGDVNDVQFLLDKGFNINQHDENVPTPLILAVNRALMTGDAAAVDIVSQLLTTGADRTIQIRGRTAEDHINQANDVTHAAIKNRLTSIFNPSVASSSAEPVATPVVEATSSSSSSSSAQPVDSDINSVDKNGLTPLMLAITTKEGYSINEVKRLIQTSGIDVNQAVKREGHPSHGLTALLWAADYGRADAVAALLAAGANINHQKSGGSTALILAARNGHADAFKVLLGSGNVSLDLLSIKNSKNESAIDLIIQKIGVFKFRDEILNPLLKEGKLLEDTPVTNYMWQKTADNMNIKAKIF